MHIYPFERLSALKEANRSVWDLLRSSMSSDEQVVLGYHFRSEGYTTFATLTDQRVTAGYIMGSSTRLIMRVFGEQKADMYVGSLLLQDISSINQIRKRLYPATPEWIVLTSYDESKKVTFFFPSRDKFYHRMLDLLHENIDRARSRKQARPPADRLRQLAGLRDDGLITEEEFQRKRKQIIEDL